MERPAHDPTPTSPSPRARILRALKMASQAIDRDDGSLEREARAARGLPRDMVDEAFAGALRDAVDDASQPPSDRARLLVAAEQFVDLAGRDRFGPHSLRLAEAILAASASAATDARATTAALEARSFELNLALALGHPAGMSLLEGERELRTRMPALWLDLARDYLSPGAFEAFAEESLLCLRMHPNELVPRLRGIHRRQGAAAVQRLLDAACVVLLTHRSRGEADIFMERVNVVSPAGWLSRFAPPDRERSSNMLSIVLYYSQRIVEGRLDPILLYKSIYLALDDFFVAELDEGRGEGDRFREILIMSALGSRHASSYRDIAQVGAACAGLKFSAEWWWASERWGEADIAGGAGEEDLGRVYAELDGSRPLPRRKPAWRMGRAAAACGLALHR